MTTSRFKELFRFLGMILLGIVAPLTITAADRAPVKLKVPAQPLLSQVHRLTEALDVVGRPLDRESAARITAIKALKSDSEIVAAVQQVLDPHCLVVVDIDIKKNDQRWLRYLNNIQIKL